MWHKVNTESLSCLTFIFIIEHDWRIQILISQQVKETCDRATEAVAVDDVVVEKAFRSKNEFFLYSKAPDCEIIVSFYEHNITSMLSNLIPCFDNEAKFNSTRFRF